MRIEAPTNRSTRTNPAFDQVIRRLIDRAGEGNRTPVTSLEGWSSTIELHPREVRRQSIARRDAVRWIGSASVRIPFRLVDVFTDRPLAGNQLCVIPEPVEATAELMQAIAK